MFIIFFILINVGILDGIIIVNNDICQKGEEGKICICDRERMFYGRDFLVCKFMEDQSIISRIKRFGNEFINFGNNLLYVFSVVNEVILIRLYLV